MRMMSHQTKNVNKKSEVIKKEANRNSGAEKAQ